MTRRRYFVRQNAKEFALDVEASGAGRFRVRLAGQAEPVEVSVLSARGPSAVLVGGRAFELHRLANGSVVLHPSRAVLQVSSQGAAHGQRTSSPPGDAGRLAAPMPGRVVKVLTAVGVTVAAGDAVMVIEAMKMENELVAPRAGVVRKIHVATGDTVERDAPLLELE